MLADHLIKKKIPSEETGEIGPIIQVENHVVFNGFRDREVVCF